MIQRRNLLLGTTALAAALSGCATRATDKPAFVLVHGAWHGAWCWDRVRPLLSSAGHAVHTPTLPGQGERAGELSGLIGLTTHIDALGAYIESLHTGPVVLVGHSYAGSVISGVADSMPSAIRRLVYLDAIILDSGESLRSIVPPASWERLEGLAREHGRGVGIPPLPLAAFGVTAPEDVAWVGSRLTLQPLATFSQPLALRAPLGNGLPKTYIDCNQPAMATQARFKDRVRGRADWGYETLATGHDAMITAPQALASLLLKLG